MFAVAHHRGTATASAPVTNPYLLDSVPIAPSLILSRFKKYTAFTSTSIQVQRDDNSDFSNIGFLPNGKIDWAAAASFVSGTPGNIRIWRDQSGFGGTYFASPGSGPMFANASGLILNGAGEEGFLYDGSNSRFTQLTAPGFDSISDIQPVSMFIRGEVVNSTGGQTSYRRIATVSNGPVAGVELRNSNNGIYMRLGATSDRILTTPGIGNTFTLTGIVGSFNEYNVWLNGTNVFSGFTSVGGGWGTDLRMGDNALQGRNYRIEEYYVWNADMTAYRTQIEASMVVQN